jgi:hypothetical protein
MRDSLGRMDDQRPRGTDDELIAPAERPSRGDRRRQARKDRAVRSALLTPPLDGSPGPVARAIEAAGAVAGPIVDAAVDAAESVAGSVAGSMTRPVETVESVAKPVVRGAVRRWRESGPGRIRQLRARSHQPLPSVWDLYPEARQAQPRELGLQTIPLSQVRGTAVEGPVQRGGDFLPIPRLRGTNWLSRWQRLRRALDRLEILPPIDVLRYDDGFWVVDGHNRVGAALYGGQEAIDASVVDLRPPGRPRASDATRAPLAQVAEEGRDVRALGEGRFTRTATSTPGVVDLRSGLDRRHGSERRGAEAGPPGEERRSGHDRRAGSDRRSES